MPGGQSQKYMCLFLEAHSLKKSRMQNVLQPKMEPTVVKYNFNFPSAFSSYFADHGCYINIVSLVPSFVDVVQVWERTDNRLDVWDVTLHIQQIMFSSW